MHLNYGRAARLDSKTFVSWQDALLLRVQHSTYGLNAMPTSLGVQNEKSRQARTTAAIVMGAQRCAILSHCDTRGHWSWREALTALPSESSYKHLLTHGRYHNGLFRRFL
jgi:hypothetical protein